MKTPLHFNPIHIYRSILREASYHPDPNARTWLKQHASSSFRTNRDKLTKEYPKWTSIEKARKETHLLSRARKFQSLLHHANHACPFHFRRTLNLVYGRRGPRRRELMHHLMTVAPKPELSSTILPGQQPLQKSTDSASLPTSILSTAPEASKPSPSATTTPSIASTSPPTPPQQPQRQQQPQLPGPPHFHTLLYTQSAASAYIPSQSRALQVKGPKTPLPATTIWNRPTPPQRAERHLQKWYAKEADTAYPPLSKPEWAIIRQIALGTVVLQTPALRARPSPLAGDGDGETRGEDWLAPLDRKLPGKTPYRRRSPADLKWRFMARWLRRQYAWLLRHVPLALPTVAATAAPAAAGSSTTTTTAASKENQEDAEPKHHGSMPANRRRLRVRSEKEGGGGRGTVKDDVTFLWDDAYTRKVFVKEQRTELDEGVRGMLFGDVQDWDEEGEMEQRGA